MATRLGEILIGQGLATPAQVESALLRQRQEGGRLGATLVSMGVISVELLLTTLRNQREAESALGLCEQMLQRWRTIYGPRHPNTSRAHDNLARAMLAAGRAADAVPHAEAALAGHIEAFGRNHACVAETARVLAEAKRAIAHTGAGAAALAAAAG